MQRGSPANGPNILSPIYLVLVIILAIEGPASAKSKSQMKRNGALAVHGETRFSEPVRMTCANDPC